MKKARSKRCPSESSGQALAATADGGQDFAALVEVIRGVHEHCAVQASRAVNVSLTARNWLIGWYIREYEQNGADRAEYGAHLLGKLADALKVSLDRCYTGRYLGLCRQLFDV